MVILTEKAEENLLKDFKKRFTEREEFCKLVYRALTEVPNSKYVEKTYTATNPVLYQIRQGGTLRGYCFLGIV